MGDEQQHQIPYLDHEFSLMNLLSVIWKRKWAIFGIVLISTILGVAAAYMKGEIYKVQVVIEPGILDIASGGKYVFMDSLENIKGKIDAYANDQKLRVPLRLNGGVQFNTTIQNKSNTLTISLETNEDNKEYGPVILGELIKELQKDYEGILLQEKRKVQRQKFFLENELAETNYQKDILRKKLKLRENEVRGLKEQKESLDNQMAILKEREKGVLDEIARTQTDPHKADLTSEALPKGLQKDNKNMNGILYSAAVNRSLRYEYENKLSDIRLMIEDVKEKEKGILKDIENNKLEMGMLELEGPLRIGTQISLKQMEIRDLEEKELIIRNLKMIGEPATLLVGPNRLAIILKYFLFGCFLGVSLVLVAEYLINLMNYKRKG